MADAGTESRHGAQGVWTQHGDVDRPELNSAADSHFILTQGTQILLTAPGQLWIDVEMFEQRAAEAIKADDQIAYQEALAIYQGDLLSEDLYDDWAATRREQLRSDHQELLLKLARLHEANGHYNQSISRFKELLAADPPNEEAHRQLMRLYAATGNRQQALRQHKECCEVLRKELDAAPEQATSAHRHSSARLSRWTLRHGFRGDGGTLPADGACAGGHQHGREIEAGPANL